MNTVTYILITLLIFVLIFNNVRLKIKLTNHITDFLKVSLDNMIIKEELAKALESKDINLNNESEAFTKFLSQSRDWAFRYIEDTQKMVQDMVDDLDDSVAYFKSYGILLTEYPGHDTLEKFIKHYEELIKLLPEDEND